MPLAILPETWTSTALVLPCTALYCLSTPSFGVRQDMFKHFNGTVNETGILLETMEKGPWDYWHLRQMLRSIFCLGPAGYGWGMRAPQAVLMGCIPVVIQVRTGRARSCRPVHVGCPVACLWTLLVTRLS